jgi:hypothetical protein
MTRLAAIIAHRMPLVLLVNANSTSPSPESATRSFRAATPTRSSHPVAGVLRSRHAVVSRQHLRDPAARQPESPDEPAMNAKLRELNDKNLTEP